VGVTDPGIGEEHRMRVAYSRVQKTYLGPGRRKFIESRGNPRAEKIRNMKSPPNIIWVTTSRRLSWMGQLKRTGKTYIYRNLIGKLKEKANWKTKTYTGKLLKLN
jgi:hypothetical protein